MSLREYEEIEVKEDTGPEFVSQLETVKKVKELRFEPAPGFGRYRMFYPCSEDGKNPDAVAHPAKMHVGFCEYLITRYTKPGETILDPMAGAGTTAVVGASLGRDVVAVELEEKFVKWQQGMKERVEEAPMLLKGEITIIRGDARKLTELLYQKVDNAVMSPPYSLGIGNGMGESTEKLAREKALGNHGIGSYVDAVVTSPAYNTRTDGGGINQTGIPHVRGKLKGVARASEYSQDRVNNIGEIRTHGSIDAVITSPAYGDSVSSRAGGGKTMAWHSKHQKGRKALPVYSQDPENISNLAFDAVMTSPPYEGSEAFMDTDFMTKISGDLDENVIAGNSKGHAKQSARMLKYKAGAHVGQGHAPSSEAEARFLAKAEAGRVEHPDSLGKLRKETYLQAMKTVYSEMYKTLKGPMLECDCGKVDVGQALSGGVLRRGGVRGATVEQGRVGDRRPSEGARGPRGDKGVLGESGGVSGAALQDRDGDQGQPPEKSHLEAPRLEGVGRRDHPQGPPPLPDREESEGSRGDRVGDEEAQHDQDPQRGGRGEAPQAGLGSVEDRSLLRSQRSPDIEDPQRAGDNGQGEEEGHRQYGCCPTCHKQYKYHPGGVAVIVVKPFNRSRRVVDLPWQTWLLLHSCGFVLEDVAKMRLRNLSFWRILQYRRYPDMERIRHEYAIVVRKPK